MNNEARRQKMVLVVDDDPVVRKVLHRTLERAGYVVVLASDGLRALHLLEDNETLDLLITDVLMPGLDGRELVQALRRDPRFQQLPMIIMSATVGIREIQRLLELGASRFLAKPLDPGLVRREVDSLLE
jgi:CheY-like chemotaxis protein